MSSIQCPICKMDACEEKSYSDYSEYICKKCGKFSMSRLVACRLEKRADIEKVSHWISEQNILLGENPEITEKKVQSILQQRDKTIKEKFDSVIKFIYKLKKIESLHDLNLFNHCYIANLEELNVIRKKMDDNKYFVHYGDYFTLSYDGIEYAEQLDAPNQNSKKIFMAFWFDEAKELQNIFDNVVKPAIDNGGFLAERVSSSTTNLENKISDEIIGMIKSSRAVIADCTGNRTAVYYEAGFARGMRIPVIWTCRTGDFENICFDVSHDPFILWDDPVDLANKIVKRLKANL